MKEQKTAYQVLNHHLSKFGLTSSVAQEGVLIAAIQEYSDQQNAELLAWKESAMSELNALDLQSLGKKLGIGLGQSVSENVHAKVDGLMERVRELEGTVSEFRTAFANYHASEGCSCCRDSDSHRDAEHAIGELLGVAKHDDDSGYDFNQYQTIYK